MKTERSALRRSPAARAHHQIPGAIADSNSRGAAIVIIELDGTIAGWNEGAEDMFGYLEDEIIGQPVAVLLDVQGAPEPAVDALVRSFASGGHSGWYRHKSGQRLFCTRSISGLDRLSDGLGRRAWIVCDVTGVREHLLMLEQRLLEQTERCNEALSADATKDRCLALISHELKQPLTTILIGVERLIELTAGTKVQRISQDLHAIRGATLRQARIVDDLLELSRIRTGKIQLEHVLVDVGELTLHISSTVCETAPDRHIRIHVDRTNGLVCMADPVRLEQIVSNLLDNAIKFTEPCGEIDVRVETADGFAKISVADDGIGISQEFLPYVFSMFGQEARRHPAATEGLGIGLALVRELAKAHRGKVSARSEGPGRGAQFTVWLPLAISPKAEGNKCGKHNKNVNPRDQALVNSLRSTAQGSRRCMKPAVRCESVVATACALNRTFLQSRSPFEEA